MLLNGAWAVLLLVSVCGALPMPSPGLPEPPLAPETPETLETPEVSAGLAGQHRAEILAASEEARQDGRLASALAAAVCPDASVCKNESWTQLSEEIPVLEADIFASGPELLCRNETLLSVMWTTAEQYEGVLFAVELFVENPALDNDTSGSQSNNLNISFVTSSVTDKDYTIFFNLMEDTKYFVMLTAYNSSGQIGESLVSGEFYTLPYDFTLNEIEKIQVENITYKSFNKLEAQITWTPTAELTCFYEVVVLNNNFLYEQIELDVSKDRHRTKISDLEYDTVYSVKLSGTIYSKLRESPEAWISFTTPTCMETHNDLAICAPSSPTNLSLEEDLLSYVISDEIFKYYDVTLRWDKPEITPEFYQINLTTSTEGFNKLSRNINGNETSVTFKRVGITSAYHVTMLAGSSGGLSKPILRYREIEPFIGAARITGTLLWAVLAPILSFVIIIGAGAFIYHRHEKQKQRKRRCQYFEELEQKAPKEADSGSTFTIHHEYDGFEIIPEKILTYEVLGEGAFGVVKKGWLCEQNKEVAVKMLKDKPSAEEVKQFRQEIDMMKSVGAHANIVSLVGCSTRPSATMMLVVEFCPLGDLQNYLRLVWDLMASQSNKLTPEDLINSSEENNPNQQIKYAELLSSEDSELNSVLMSHPNLIVNKLYGLQEDIIENNSSEKDINLTAVDLLSFGRQISMGMEFLSSNRVVHRDLAARNVLVCANKVIKIADFGLSRDIYQENMYRKTGSGKLPIKWMALESLTHQVYTTQSDVWSFGILLWEIVTLGGNPYPSVPTSKLLNLLISGYRMECPNNCSQDLYSLMVACWRTRPKERPNFSEIRQSLDFLMEGICSNMYLSLDVMHQKEIKDMRLIASDQPSRCSDNSLQTKQERSTDGERYVRPISINKNKTSAGGILPNRYNSHPVTLGEYPNSQINFMDDHISTSHSVPQTTQQFKVHESSTLPMKSTSVPENSTVSNILNGNIHRTVTYSNRKNSISCQPKLILT